MMNSDEIIEKVNIAVQEGDFPSIGDCNYDEWLENKDKLLVKTTAQEIFKELETYYVEYDRGIEGVHYMDIADLKNKWCGE